MGRRMEGTSSPISLFREGSAHHAKQLKFAGGKPGRRRLLRGASRVIGRRAGFERPRWAPKGRKSVMRQGAS